MPTPHYLRFARTLALVGGLAGATGCATSHTREGEPRPDASISVRDGAVFRPDAARPDAARADAATPDSGHTCATCECESFGGDDPDIIGCEEVGLWDCCVAIGPLFPPDLPA